MRRSVYDILFSLYLQLLRPMVKWFMHVYTGQCEVERIVYGKKTLCGKVFAIEYALQQSRAHELRSIPERGEPDKIAMYAHNIVRVKYITGPDQDIFICRLSEVLEPLLEYRALVEDIELHRQVEFEPTNTDHCELLRELYSFLRPDDELSDTLLKTDQWKEIGFQGQDPTTDFRGMGLLGIAVTSWVRDLLRRGHLKTHVYNSLASVDGLECVHEVYCSVFTMFCDRWRREEPETVMEFGRVRDMFLQELSTFLLSSQNVVLPKSDYSEVVVPPVYR